MLQIELFHLRNIGNEHLVRISENKGEKKDSGCSQLMSDFVFKHSFFASQTGTTECLKPLYPLVHFSFDVYCSPLS